MMRFAAIPGFATLPMGRELTTRTDKTRGRFSLDGADDLIDALAARKAQLIIRQTLSLRNSNFAHVGITILRDEIKTSPPVPIRGQKTGSTYEFGMKKGEASRSGSLRP